MNTARHLVTRPFRSTIRVPARSTLLTVKIVPLASHIGPIVILVLIIAPRAKRNSLPLQLHIDMVAFPRRGRVCKVKVVTNGERLARLDNSSFNSFLRRFVFCFQIVGFLLETGQRVI